MKKWLIVFFLFSNLSYAGNLHLMAGGGANFSLFKGQDEKLVAGSGLNISTDLGYYFNDQWAFEWSVKVKFNKLDDVLVWDTLMTVGPRYQFKNSPYYTRVFYGRSPTVLHSGGKGFLSSETGDSRIQFDGPVYGLAFGKIFKTQKDRIWFTEVSLSYQSLNKRTGIRDEGDIPVETFKGDINDPIEIFSVMAIFGVRVF